MYKYWYSIAVLHLPWQHTVHYQHSPERALMAEKVSTLVVTLNYGCCRCFTKIRKTVCKLQETEGIRTVSYDEVSRTVMISGSFDPLVLPCKLRRKAGSLIRDIQLVEAELRLTPQRPPRPVQRATMLPNLSGGLAALARSCYCGICRCGGYSGYGCCYCGCFVNHLSAGYYGELPLGQNPKVACDCEEASSPGPACKIM